MMDKKYDFDTLVTANEKMLKIIERAKKISSSDIILFLTGEPGTGKQSLAHAIHLQSPRRENAFISLDCASISPALLETELMGKQGHEGKIKDAAKGTLYLRDIEHLSLKTQQKILQKIMDKENPLLARLIVSSTNPLGSYVKKGTFHPDLYYRLNEITMEIPPLRERREDIALLIQYFIGEFNEHFHKKVQCLSNVALNYLLNYEWPGNVWELRNIVKTAIALSDREVLWLEDLPLKITLTNERLWEDQDKNSYSLKLAEKGHILKVLNMCRWNKSKAAKALEVSRPRLDRKITEYGLHKN